TGSEIAASTWVASPGLCLRTSSITFCSAPASACEVVAVAATAADGGGWRGGSAACWRVAGSMAGAKWRAAGWPDLLAFFAVEVVFGTALRAIGRDFGSGTFGFVAAPAASAGQPIASPRPAARAVDKAIERNAAACADRVTAFLRGESFNVLGLLD